MWLTQHGTEIKMCYRVTRDRFSESRDVLSIAAQRCTMLTSCAIRMLYAIHHCRACKTAFNSSKSSTLSSSRSCFNLNYNATQLSVTVLRKRAVSCTLAANHHQTIGSVTTQKAVRCCQRLHPRLLTSSSVCKIVVTCFLA